MPSPYLYLKLSIEDQTDDDNPHVPLHKTDQFGAPATVAATLRAVADQLDPPRRPTR